MITVDVEATGLEQWAPGFKVFMVQWADEHGEYVCDEDTGWQPFLDRLAREEMLVLANASYDIHALYTSGIVDLLDGPWRLHDVQTLARVVIPGRFSYKLEALGTDLLGKDATEAQRALKLAAHEHSLPWTQKQKDYYGLWRAEPELMERYGKEDVRLTYDLWKLIWPRATAEDRSVYKMEITGVAPLLREAEREGVLVNKTRLRKLKRKLTAERDEYRLKLLAQGFSPEALGDEDAKNSSSIALVDDLLRNGVPLYRKTPKSGELHPTTGKRNPDKFAVNKDALKEFEVRYPAVRDLLAWRLCNTVLRTYVGALEKANPRVHTTFSQAEARTSRMSASKPNMQNLPTPENDVLGVRDVLIPEPGNAFIVGDYSSIEVMMLAHMIADLGLIADLEDGMDLYSRCASLVYNKPYEECGKKGRYADLRQRSKTTVLTCMYGGGARLLGTRLGVSTEEAALIKADTLGAIPGYFEFDARVKRAVQMRSFPHVVSILGRRLHVPRDKPYVGLNTVIQGNSAEIMKLGLIAAAPAIKPLGYRPLLVVHDELLAEGPAGNAEEALLVLKSAMESVYPLRPRLQVSGDWSVDSYGAAK